MNLLLLSDVICLALVIFVMAFFVAVRGLEDVKFHRRISAMLFGMFFIMVYLILDILAFLLASYNYSVFGVVYSNALLVMPLAGVFFFVSALLPSE